jgi:predicted RNA binding protein YcfA (HicA-like mRNA interferase family)
MKRKGLIRHLERHGCEFLREGANHTVYINRIKRKVSTVPRHNEIFENLCRKICKDLDIPLPSQLNPADVELKRHR